MTEYKPKKMDHHNHPSVQPIDPKTGNLANRDEEDENQANNLSWITKESLIKQFTAENKERFDTKLLPRSALMKTILMKYFRSEFLLLGKHEYKFRFHRLPEYSNMEMIRSAFKPMKLVNSSKLTAKYMVDSIVAYARATSFDDIHKVE